MFSVPQDTDGAALSTKSVHAGEARAKPYGSLTTPIIQTSTYTFEDTASLIEHMRRKEQGLDPVRGEYGRYGNPTQEAVEHKIAALDGAEAALALASGMAALTSTLLTFLESGDHVILTEDCYRRSRQFCIEFVAKFGVSCTLVPLGDYEALEAAVKPNTRILVSETPTNPYLRVADLPRLAALSEEHGLITVVDTTFGTPCNVRPIEQGIDLVLHSATKYLGGHNDLLAGVIVGSAEHIAAVRETAALLGPVADPHTLYLLNRGLKTLSLRMTRHNENGQRIAEFLEEHPAIRRVWYPGLPSHPDHDLARRQMSGFGGVISFEVDSDLEGTGRFIDALRIPYMGPSLGGVESIVEQPALMSHFTLNEEERAALGIGGELVRYAAGVEDAQDLIADLSQALSHVATPIPSGGADTSASFRPQESAR